MNVTYNEGQRVPVKAWTDGVEVEEAAKKQLHNVSTLPFVGPHVAVMPDVHFGKGATVGSVIPTYKAIIPAAVGVDLGCGMIAVKLDAKASDLPDNLSEMRSALETAIPHGRSHNGGPNDRGAWADEIPSFVESTWGYLKSKFDTILAKHPSLDTGERAVKQLGTLGTGNHFIEVCEEIGSDSLWLMLHTGSRGIGNRIGSYFIEKAKREMERWHISLPDKDLAYLAEGSEFYDDYIEAVGWAQEYASQNRHLMMHRALAVLSGALKRPQPLRIFAQAVECHHNYISKEHHFGRDLWITRKGAVSAKEGQLGIIPGSMGAKSFIVRGKGNRDSFHSCSHGAGRKMSRTEAKKRFTLEDHAKATEGVECRKDADVVDETPGAYKDVEAVMRAQSDLVEVVCTLKQVLCVKG